ncbi:hypothetical protein SAMN04487947_0745 [Halogeometricum rufum]|uniref:Apea-like HEPN domain-containing protein n=1 Tax=Halogeometricum rufum TaxID=553469 RepID=A0A1I6G8P5_9EURY|nr:hypothetical protein [Halogeometricum rufum]SFR38549.1 hypothetical protein SAMN04487947_0745 [Halogeometricum rufum]
MSSVAAGLVLNWALKEVRYAAEQGETTSIWAHGERYPQILAILSHRLDPDIPDSNSGDRDSKTFGFDVRLPDHHRVHVIHSAIESIVRCEEELLEAYEARADDDDRVRSLFDGPPSPWAEDLSPSQIHSIEENLGIGQSQLPEDWKPHAIFEKILNKNDTNDESRTFQIYCALNLVGSDGGRLPSVLNIGGSAVRTVTSEQWESVVESALSSGSVRDIEHPEESFSQYCDSDGLPSDNTVSYWRVKYDASSVEEANVQFRRTIQAILGGVATVVYDHETDYAPYDIPEYTDSIDKSHVPMPPFHLICDEDHNCLNFGTTNAVEYGSPHRLSSEQSEQVDELFVRTGCDQEITEAWRKGLAAYHRSFAADTIIDEYHCLWQAVEALVMTDGGSSDSKDVIEYGSGAVKNQPDRADSSVPWNRPSRYKLLKMRLDVLRRRRNHVVHGGEETGVYGRDTASLRIALDGLIDLYLEMFASGVERQAAEGILWYGHKSEKAIEDSVSDISELCGDLEDELEEKNIQLKRRQSAQNWNGYD